MLNPLGYVVKERDVGFVVATSAERVQEMIDTFSRAELFQQQMVEGGGGGGGGGFDGAFVGSSNPMYGDTFPRRGGGGGGENSGGENSGGSLFQRSNKFTANSGKGLMLRQMEQLTINGLSSKQKNNCNRNAGSVQLPLRPNIRRGTATAEELFGMPTGHLGGLSGGGGGGGGRLKGIEEKMEWSPPKISENGSSMDGSSSGNNGGSWTSERKQQRGVDDRRNNASGGGEGGGGGSGSSPTIDPADRDSRASRLIGKFRVDKMIDTVEKERELEDVVLTHCRRSDGRRNGRSSGRSSERRRKKKQSKKMTFSGKKNLAYFGRHHFSF